MIPPRKVAFEAKRKENENMRFRTYLKIHADEEDLDQRFLRLHQELFAKYDCDRCRNCCKLFRGSIPVKDIERDAANLQLSSEQFTEKYLEKSEGAEYYNTKHKPCDFLQSDGTCLLGECCPENCKKYPYTNQPERLQSLYSVLKAVEVCPVAFEIYERLKEEYGFKKRG